MKSLQVVGSRLAIPFWVLLGLAVIGFVADLEGTIQFAKRVLRLQLPEVPVWAPLSLALSGLAYLGWLWHAEQVTEPLRQLFRAVGAPAAGHRQQLSRAVEEVLAGHGEIGRLARTALEEMRSSVEGAQTRVTSTLEGRGVLARLRARESQRRFVVFLETYERSVYRLRDGASAAAYDLHSHPNFVHWKRLDTELLSGVRDLVHQSRYSYMRTALRGFWREGVRGYL